MGPFRELFVEVPQALLEAAVIEAQQRQRPASATAVRHQSEPVGLVRILPEVFKRRYGWRGAVVVSRSARDALILVRGVSSCGHFQCVDIDERVVFAGASAATVDTIDTYVQTQRGCYCMYPVRA